MQKGWPYNNVTMNDTLRARNICYAEMLSLQWPGVVTVFGTFGCFCFCEYGLIC